MSKMMSNGNSNESSESTYTRLVEYVWVTTSGILKSGHQTDGSVSKGSSTLL